MDRENALKLLKGGGKGVQDWNEWRQTSEDIPDLSCVSLAGATLANVDLRGAFLEGATLGGADLAGANLGEAYLAEADLSEANLTNADLRWANLTGANLRSTILKDAKLEHTTLNNSDLQDTDLRGFPGLSAETFAGASLTGAKLPDEIKAFEALVTLREACSNARTIFLAMLLGCAYAVLTIGTTNDAALITNSASSPLPIIGAPIPIVGFYLAAPLLLFSFYLYFHLCMQNIWERLGTLPARLPDGRSLDKAADPWLVIGLLQAHLNRLRNERTFLSHLQESVSILLAWCAVPLTLLMLWYRYLVAHDPRVTFLQVAFLGATVAMGIYAYRRAVPTLRGVKPLPFRWGDWRNHFAELRTSPAWLATTVLLATCLIGSGGAIGGVFRSADVRGADLSTKPGRWTGSELDQVKPAQLRGANLHGLRGSGAFFAKADLREANLILSHLGNADLRGADLREANLRGADLRGADFQDAQLDGANLRGADLARSNVSDSQILGSCLGDSTTLPRCQGFLGRRNYSPPKACGERWPKSFPTRVTKPR